MKAAAVSTVVSRAMRGFVLAFIVAVGACDSGVCLPSGAGGAGGSPATGGGGATGSAGAGGGRSSTGGAGGSCPPVGPFAMTGCPAVSGAPLGVESHPEEGFAHLVLCSTTCYATNPPSSGNHYPIWPLYKTYSAPVPWGFLVHGLEHGAIIVSYNCPCGCAGEVAAAQAWIDALPADQYCSSSTHSEKAHAVLVPDPTLDVSWAASAWTWTLRADSFDAAAFQSFFSDHYEQGREVVCDSSPGTDGTATGWCQ